MAQQPKSFRGCLMTRRESHAIASPLCELVEEKPSQALSGSSDVRAFRMNVLQS